MERKPKILVADDEADLVFVLEQVLTAQGYEVHSALDGFQCLDEYRACPPDLIILDRMMPGKSGEQVACEIRLQDKHTPILFLTARSSDSDILEGFSCGASDYIRKPFSMQELLARVRAFLSLHESMDAEPEELEIGRFRLLTVSQELCFEGERTALTNMEYNLLKLLIQNKNREVSMDAIISTIWKGESFCSNANVHVYISKLRKLLSRDSGVKLLSLRAVGYKLVELR